LEHPSAFAYDFRSRFGVSSFEIGRGISYGEAYLLVAQLLKDTSSAVFAAANEWDHPFSREGLVLADLFDLTVQATSSKKVRTRYPRPFTPGAKRIGRTNKSPVEVKRLLARMNPKKENDGN
jgi:hypothetical protein